MAPLRRHATTAMAPQRTMQRRVGCGYVVLPAVDHPTPSLSPRTPTTPPQLEEDLGDHLKWSMRVSRGLHTGQSPYQSMELLQTPAFGKVRCIQIFGSVHVTNIPQILLLDGKVQSSEADEKVYHELLVHPAMLHHPNPRRVFICGGASSLGVGCKGTHPLH